jgi:hypothetical protein
MMAAMEGGAPVEEAPPAADAVPVGANGHRGDVLVGPRGTDSPGSANGAAGDGRGVTPRRKEQPLPVPKRSPVAIPIAEEILP